MTVVNTLQDGEKIFFIEKNIELVVSNVESEHEEIYDNGKLQKFLILEDGSYYAYDFMASTLETDETGYQQLYDFLMEEEGVRWKKV